MENNGKQESALLKFDIRVLFISLRRRTAVILLGSIIATLAGGILARNIVDDKWQARARRNG